MKFRALRLDAGNFAWGSENCTRKARILDVVYNASSNELVRTKTLFKGTIIAVDAAPFKQWYLSHYNIQLSSKDGAANTLKPRRARTMTRRTDPKHGYRKVDDSLKTSFESNRLLACISSRPGQCGRCDGYILEGDELAFYKKKIEKKR